MAEKRGNLYSGDPVTDIAIAGGLAIDESHWRIASSDKGAFDDESGDLVDERGDLDTELDATHVLYDVRLLAEEGKLDEPFVRTIDAFGVTVPIRCKKIGGVTFVVQGRRRLRGARVSNRMRALRGEPPMRVDYVLEGSNDQTRLMGLITVENAARSDSGFATTMAQLRVYLDRGVGIEDAAVMLAEKPNVVRGWVAFDEQAIEPLRELVYKGAMSISSGVEIMRAGDGEAQLAALEVAVNDAVAEAPEGETPKVTTRAARTAAKTVTRPNAHVAVSDRKTQLRLLQAVQDKSHNLKATRTLDFFEGGENMLKLIMGGDEAKEADPRFVELLKEVRKAMRSAKSGR